MEFVETLFHADQIPSMYFLPQSMNLPLSKEFLPTGVTVYKNILVQ